MRGGSGARADYPVLVPPREVPAVNITEMVGATDLSDYTHRATRWADAVWESWAHEHDRVLATLDGPEPLRPSHRARDD